MPRHSLSVAEQIAGVKAALRSKRTPHQFRPALHRRLRELEGKLKKSAPARVRRPKFLGWFKL
jgi:hypothetical protein